MVKRLESSITDRECLIGQCYRDPLLIKQRQTIYEYTLPKWNIEDEVTKLSKLSGREQIIDVGCGRGQLLYRLAKLFPRLTLVGLDISSYMYQDIATKARQEKLNIDFFEGDAQAIPYANQSFDRVILMHMLYHVPDINRVLSEAARILKPGGIVVVTANSLLSKPNLRHLRRITAKTLEPSQFVDATTRFNTTNGVKYTRRYFSQAKLTLYKSTLRLKNPQPYVDYFDSTRGFWNPIPDRNKWKKALFSVRNYIQQQITSTGEFEEENIFGIITAIKN